jgi:hypothetical protein
VERPLCETDLEHAYISDFGMNCNCVGFAFEFIDQVYGLAGGLKRPDVPYSHIVSLMQSCEVEEEANPF